MTEENIRVQQTRTAVLLVVEVVGGSWRKMPPRRPYIIL